MGPLRPTREILSNLARPGRCAAGPGVRCTPPDAPSGLGDAQRAGAPSGLADSDRDRLATGGSGSYRGGAGSQPGRVSHQRNRALASVCLVEAATRVHGRW